MTSTQHADAAAIDPGVAIGHVNLKVSDLDRALWFWCDVLGFRLKQSGPGCAFVAAGSYHHHIALNTWESQGGAPPAAGSTGLYHVAILYPERSALADALKRIRDAGIALEGAYDHGVSLSLYVRDPDHNGVELYWDRPAAEWPRQAGGGIAMGRQPIDPDLIAGQAEAVPGRVASIEI
jgi:catechol 2,3-dioxygenase